MNVVSIQTMQEIDRKSIEDYSIASLMLMEYDGKNIFGKILKRHKIKLEKSSLNIFCGVGGNGGDGLVIARHTIERCHKDFLSNYNILKSMNILIIKQSNI